MNALEFTGAGHLLRTADAPLVAAFLEALEKKRGRLDTKEQCQALVEYCRKPKSPLHHLFNWDDEEEAASSRLKTARLIIGEVLVTWKNSPEPPTRAFRIVTTEGKRGPHPIQKILKSPDLTKAMLEEALADLARWEKRYQSLRHLVELRGVFTAVSAVSERI